jgi:hypothetical protein
MAHTVACPRCFRNVPWTGDTWSAEEHCCRECADGVSSGMGRKFEARTTAPVRTGDRGSSTVHLVSVDIPFDELFRFLIKFLVAWICAGLVVGLVIGILYFGVRLLLGD